MSELTKVPVLAATQAEALSLLQDVDVEIPKIAGTVEADPALTAAVLRAANSAASSPIDRVTTAERAVMRIGLSATHRIVTGAVIGSSFNDLRSAGLDPDELWRHVIACALLADTATRDGAGRSQGFTAGLLHDIGRMAMAQADPERYAKVVAGARAGRNVERVRVGNGASEQQRILGTEIRVPAWLGHERQFSARIREAAAAGNQKPGAPVVAYLDDTRLLKAFLGVSTNPEGVRVHDAIEHEGIGRVVRDRRIELENDSAPRVARRVTQTHHVVFVKWHGRT